MVNVRVLVSRNSCLSIFLIPILLVGIDARIVLPSNVTVPALIGFGDSIIDPGNNNHLATLIKCDFPPYGKDFMHGHPTGRFSNGRIPTDLIVDELGLKRYLPAYLDPNLNPEELLSGVSFASGASGYDPLTSSVAEIYGLGARRIAVFGAPPIGCVPSQRTIGGGPSRMCADDYNRVALLFNSKLSARLTSLRSTLPNSRIVYIDIYTPLLDMILSPTKYGFEVVTEGCCGTGLIEVTLLCNKLDPVCADDTKYLFWDSYHPTEKGYRFLTGILGKYVDDLV